MLHVMTQLGRPSLASVKTQVDRYQRPGGCQPRLSIFDGFRETAPPGWRFSQTCSFVVPTGHAGGMPRQRSVERGVLRGERPTRTEDHTLVPRDRFAEEPVPVRRRLRDVREERARRKARRFSRGLLAASLLQISLSLSLSLWRLSLSLSGDSLPETILHKKPRASLDASCQEM